MFKKIAVAFDESPEADRALHSALSLAKLASSQLYIITVIEGFPAYMGYVSAVAPEAARVMKEERRTFYHDLQDRAKAAAEEVDLALRSELVEGDEVEALLSAIHRIEPDLLVVGLRQDAGGLSRYLGGTAHRLAQHARCDVLGVR